MEELKRQFVTAIRKIITCLLITCGSMALGKFVLWFAAIHDVLTPLFVDWLFRANYIRLDYIPVFRMFVEYVIDSNLPKDARPLDIYHVLVLKNGIEIANYAVFDTIFVAGFYIFWPFYKHSCDEGKS